MTRLGTPEALRKRLDELGIALPFDESVDAKGPLAAPLTVPRAPRLELANRFAILPMEGWDASREGRPTDLVHRRWERFGASGAALIWGGEAYAVQPSGRANPRQLCANAESARDLVALRERVVGAHREVCEGAAPVLGLQLTHSGRFSRPEGSPAPRTAYRDPVLDARVGIDSDAALLHDSELDALIEDFAQLAEQARDAGFDFVDVKACHGYLLHEFLSAHERPGPYGGDLGGRARLLLRAIEAVRGAAPELAIGVRLSIFDWAPYRPDPAEHGVGAPEPGARAAFGAPGASGDFDLEEVHALLGMLGRAGVALLCTTAGSPYYNPHIQRPAFYPPSDGYRPPEDPLVGVARQLRATAEIKARHPEFCVVGSAYTYLQEWLPRVAQAVVREGGADLVGLGRMVLSYPQLPRDVLAGAALEKPLICRTFSDCTTAPRNGLVSGCYPIDEAYKRSPEAEALARIKRAQKAPEA